MAMHAIPRRSSACLTSWPLLTQLWTWVSSPGVTGEWCRQMGRALMILTDHVNKPAKANSGTSVGRDLVWFGASIGTISKAFVHYMVELRHGLTWRDMEAWWRHQMETFPLCRPFVRGINRSPVNSPHKGQWHRSFDVFFHLHLNKRLSKQSWGWWFETPSRSLWRHCNDECIIQRYKQPGRQWTETHRRSCDDL